jgi:hypothetical protein
MTDDAQDLFAAGTPWTVKRGEQADPDEGHCVLQVGWRLDGLDTVVTWGRTQTAEQGWYRVCVQEAWAVVTKDDMSAEGFEALKKDLDALPEVTSDAARHPFE